MRTVFHFHDDALSFDWVASWEQRTEKESSKQKHPIKSIWLCVMMEFGSKSLERCWFRLRCQRIRSKWGLTRFVWLRKSGTGCCKRKVILSCVNLAHTSLRTLRSSRCWCKMLQRNPVPVYFRLRCSLFTDTARLELWKLEDRGGYSPNNCKV